MSSATAFRAASSVAWFSGRPSSAAFVCVAITVLGATPPKARCASPMLHSPAPVRFQGRILCPLQICTRQQASGKGSTYNITMVKPSIAASRVGKGQSVNNLSQAT